MIEESLKKLEVAVKGGGNIVSHPPVFSPDSKTLYIIQKNTAILYSTETGRCVGKFSTPSAATIANLVHLEDSPDRLIVFTSSGILLEVDATTLEIQSTRKVHLKPKEWTPIISVLNFIWSTENSSEASHFCLVAYPQDATLPVLYAVKRQDKSKHLHLQFLCKEIVPNFHSVACGRNGKFIVGIQANSLFLKDITTKECRWHSGGSRKFTCVAVHPTDWVCATGDDSGRIIIWTNALGTDLPVAKTIFHWHTLPVADLCFSTDGSHMFSGGGECTLIKWDVKNTDNKRTLPRLGLPIRHVRRSPKNELVVISQADNGIQLVNAHNTVVNRIQNITQCYIPDGIQDINLSESSFGGSQLYQAGLHIDPNNSSLITNGRPGHLQCYSFRSDSHLYSLDITQQNFITAERNKPIPNSNVISVSFSKNGTWLSTAESRTDKQKTTELRLKFWKFQKNKQIFVLNTSIEWPHENGLLSLKIQPISDDDSTLIAATSGMDKKFKTWGVVKDPSIHGKSEWWNCENAGSYRDLPCGPLTFSRDGSLLAVAFSKILTVWAADTHELKISLCHSNVKESITLVEFGSQVSSHIVITCTSQNIVTWDVITASMLWVAPLHAVSIAVDPFSNLAAAFSSKNHLIFFSPDKPDILAVHKNVSSSKVISSVFVSHEELGNTGLKSTVFFINSSQELCALLPPIDKSLEETIRINSDGDKSSLTPFAQLIAETTVYEPNKKPLELTARQTGMPEYQVLRDIMDQSPHTMPSLTYFCTRLLKSLSIPRTQSDDFNEIEQAVTESFAKQPTTSKKGGSRYEKWRPLTDDEEEITFDDLEFSTSNKTIEGIKKPAATYDLDAVVNDNISWIENVFNRN